MALRTMTESDIKNIQNEIEIVLRKHGAYYNVENVFSPKLKFINTTISLKVTEDEKKSS